MYKRQLYDLASSYVKGTRALTPKAEKDDLIDPAQNPNIATDVDPTSAFGAYEGPTEALMHAWDATQKVATDKFLDEYRKEDGSKLTQEEKRNFFTEQSVASEAERHRAKAEIEKLRKTISWDDPALRHEALLAYEIEAEDKVVRKNMERSIEALSSNEFNKTSLQGQLKFESGIKVKQLEREKHDVLAESKVVTQRWQENNLQLAKISEQIQNFNFDQRVKDIQSRTLKTQEDVDKANADLKNVYTEYGVLVDKYNSLTRAGTQFQKMAYDVNERIQDLDLDIRNFGVYQEYVDDNYQIGTQLAVELSDALIDLGQGLVGAVEMVFDAGAWVSGRITDKTITIDEDTDPDIAAWVQWLKGDNGYGGFERSHGWLDDINDGIDGWQAERREGVQQVSWGSIESASDFGEYASVMLFGQIPNLALMYFTGGTSLYVMGASSAGQKYNDLRASNELYRETGGFYGTNHSFGEMFLSASLTGTAEALSEKVTLGQMSAMTKTFKQIFQDVGFKAGVRKYVKEVVMSPRAIGVLGKDLLEEGGSEACLLYTSPSPRD